MIERNHIDGYEKYLEENRYSSNYKRNLLYYANGLVGQEITDDNVNSLILRHNNNLYRAFLRSFINYLKLDIKVKNPKGRSRELTVKYFTVEEIRQIIDNVDTKLKIMCLLMFENGLRVSEVMNLKRNSFDLINKRVRGIGKGNVEFDMPLSERLADIIGRFTEGKEGDMYVFRWERIKHQRQKALYEIKKNIRQILPYKKKEEVYCHVFRDSCGTYLLDFMSVREVQVWLRHKQLETTARYTAVKPGQLIDKWEKAMGCYI